MKLPLNNIKQYTNLPNDIEDTISILANKIGEVESYINLSDKYKNIVIATIKEKRKHPNADKLGIYIIDTGKEDIQVLAGDKTLEVGDKVAYIRPGGVVPNTYSTEPFEIKSMNMRGEMSNGMMCSEKELDIGPDHKKVLRLSKDAPIGEDFSVYYELNDYVIDIENKALTNRGDLFGILGLSRELAGAQNIKFESPQWYKEKIILEPKKVCLNIDVDNQAESLCPRYCAITMSNISMKESPIWLKSILLKSDIKPINVVVDITNYLMILTGQPLHAFDYDKVIKTDTAQADMAHIVIRTAKPKESIHALDGNIYELNDRNLVIANSENPIALAGAIGGKETEIDENTTNIILESANFDKYNLRRTSMDLGIVTDASTRFTRSQSPQLCDKVISKAAQLIKELAKGELSSTLIDSYPVPRDSKIVTINIEKMREKLGIDISNENVINLLENIEYNIIEIKENYLTIEVPPFRQDIEIEEDIYEDIIRIYGYEKITPILPTKKIHATTRPAINKIKQEIRSILANSGANELISYSFTNTELLNLVNQNIDDCYKIKNPLSKDLELMRPSIIQSLLEKAQLNIQQGIETFSIFEMGISHQKGLLDKDNLPLEEWKLSYLFTDSKNLIDGNSYYEAKRYLEKVLYQFTGNPLHYTLLADSDFENLPKWIKSISGSFEPNSSAIVEIKVGDSKITLGIVGEISTTVQKNLSLNNFTSGFEINLEKLSQLQTNSTTEILIESKYPYITQDICFIVPNKITYSELYKIVTKSIDKDKVRFDIKCLDIYQKDDNKDRNITLRISISNTEKTLNDKDFQKIREKLEKNIKKKNISMLQ